MPCPGQKTLNMGVSSPISEIDRATVAVDLSVAKIGGVVKTQSGQNWSELVPDVPAALGDWPAGPGPLHAKLADGLRAAIARGALPAGARLPPERALAAALAVSRSTVVAAYDRLRSEALLVSRQGSGTRVAPGLRRPPGDGAVPGARGESVFRHLVEGPGEMISLGCAIAPCHPAVAEALASLEGGEVAAALASPGYHPLGLPSLRSALADLHTREGVPTRPEQILVTTGAQQAVSVAAALFVRPGETVVVESPGFPSVHDVFRAGGARLASVPVDGEGVVVEEIRHLARRMPVAAVFVMPSFHNPTGVALSAGRRRRLAALAAELGIPVLEDNALEHARLGVVPPPPVGALGDGPVVGIGSLSKVLWGGLRVGWVRASEEMVGRLVRVKVRHDLGTGVVDQLVAARLVPSLERLRDQRQAELLAAVDHLGGLLARRLPGWAWERPQGGPSLWVRLPWGDADTYAQVALRHGVEVVPGSAMAPGGTHRDHLRVPFTLDRPEVLVERLGAAWDAYAPGGAAAGERLDLVV